MSKSEQLYGIMRTAYNDRFGQEGAPELLKEKVPEGTPLSFQPKTSLPEDTEEALAKKLEDAEKRRVLKEKQRVLAKEFCQLDGHNWEPAFGLGETWFIQHGMQLECAKCGAVGKVVVNVVEV